MEPPTSGLLSPNIAKILGALLCGIEMLVGKSSGHWSHNRCPMDGTKGMLPNVVAFNALEYTFGPTTHRTREFRKCDIPMAVKKGHWMEGRVAARKNGR